MRIFRRYWSLYLFVAGYPWFDMFSSSKKIVLFVRCVILSCLTLGVHTALPLEQYFRCHRSDTNFSECVTNVFNELQPIVAEGIPDLGIKPFEPLVIPKMEVDNIQGGKFKQELTDMIIRGLKYAKITSADFTKLPRSMAMNWEIPDLRVMNNYTMEGFIMGIPLKGKGQAFFNCTHLRSRMRLGTELVSINGADHLQVTDVRYALEAPRTAKLRFTNSLSKDKKLTEATSKFFNDNWRTIFDLVKNVRTGAVESMMKEGLNKLFSTYPYDQIFPK